MGKSNLTVAALVLAVSIVLLGWLLRSGVVHFKDSERVVTVKGLSEREVKANKVIWPLVYKEVGDNLLSLYNTIEQTNAKIVEFLKSNGIESSEISVKPSELTDLAADRYAAQTARYRYNVTTVITVSTDKVDIVRELMSRQVDLLKQGVAVTGGDYQFNTEYMYTELNEIKPDMIEEATKSAREAAEKFATDSRSRLGKIRSATQGQFTISDRDANTPYIKTVRVVTTVQYYLKD